MRMMRAKIVKIHLDPVGDLDLIKDWDSQPHRDKSKTIKDRWRAGLQRGNNSQLDLAAIRKVIESVLDSKLAGLNLVQGTEKEIVVDLMNELDGDLLL